MAAARAAAPAMSTAETYAAIVAMPATIAAATLTRTPSERAVSIVVIYLGVLLSASVITPSMPETTPLPLTTM